MDTVAALVLKCHIKGLPFVLAIRLLLASSHDHPYCSLSFTFVCTTGQDYQQQPKGSKLSHSPLSFYLLAVTLVGNYRPVVQNEIFKEGLSLLSLASLSKSTVNVTTATAFTSSHALFRFLKTVLEPLCSSSFSLFKTRFTKSNYCT
jgi:hypothetical protein